MERFNYEEFDYDNVYKEVLENIKKPNILICGATGVGKSEFINSIFGSEKVEVGNDAKPTTRGTGWVTDSNANVNVFDSEGYEIGEDKQEYYFEKILNIIDKKREENPDDIDRHIHEVWYCVSCGNKKFYDLDSKIIKKVREQKKIPVAVILTKVDLISEEDLEELKTTIEKDISGIKVFTYSAKIDESTEIYKKYVQLDELIEWAINNISDSLTLVLVSAVKGSLKAKRKIVQKNIIPRYTTMAASAVVATSVISQIPFSDSIPLMALQVKMSYEILKVYNIDEFKEKMLKDVIGTQFISYLGKTLASQIWGMIPLIGNFAKGAVNTTIAATVTATLGMAISIVTEKYLEACIENNGSENLSFNDFFTNEKLKEAVNWIKNNEDMGVDIGFSISEIVEKVTEKVKVNK